MANLLCDQITDGLRKSEAVASFVDFSGRRHFIRVERDFLGARNQLPIGVIHVDQKTKAVLVELPHEAETGANRVWLKPAQLDEPIEEFA
jgi:hypothetical protein